MQPLTQASISEAFVLDTETAGLDGGVCDIAICKINSDLQIIWEVESLIDPERPIAPQASGIHHITDDMVQFEPTLSEFMEMQGYPLDREGAIIGGHNVQFDIRMIGEFIPRVHRKLCTLKLARVLWPDAPDHKLQTLRYMFKLDAGTAHRAMGDVRTCISLLRMVAEERGLDLQGILALVAKPLTLDAKMPFGKHQGTKLKDLPSSYVQWLLNKADNLDADLREALSQR